VQKVFLSFIAPSILCFIAFPTATQAQSDAAKLYKTNCAFVTQPMAVETVRPARRSTPRICAPRRFKSKAMRR
jgi:hypothetical protein